MFGMTAVTAWELEAERRRELAFSCRAIPDSKTITRRDAGPVVSLLRLIGAVRQAPPAGWEDVRM